MLAKYNHNLGKRTSSKWNIQIADIFESDSLYYHPSKLTLYDTIGCLFAVAFPELLFVLFIFSLPVAKYLCISKKLVFQLLLLALICVAEYILGRQQMAGGGISLIAGIYFLSVRLVSLLFLIEGSFEKRSARVFLFIKLTLVYLILSFVIDAIFFKSYNAREVVLLGHLGPANSTNYINILVLCLSGLLLFKDRSFYIYLLFVIWLSFVWDNRTGLLCCAGLLCIQLFKQSKLLAILLLLPLIYYGTDLISNTRLAEQGLDSLRWLTQLDALNDLLNLEHPYGGYVNYLGDTEWLHNVYLDAYRLSGIMPVVLLVIFSLYPFFRMPKSRLFYILLCSLLVLIISMTSIIFEGTHLEFLFYFILLYNADLMAPGKLKN